MQITTNEHNEIVLIWNDEENNIHFIHCSEDLQELKGDNAKPYIVAEECTNFARIHLVTNYSEDEALQQVDEYLREKENVADSHLIGVFECNF
jgi:hypothetical protein